MSATSETLTAAVCIFENPASGNTAYKERLQIQLEKETRIRVVPMSRISCFSSFYSSLG